MHKLFLLFDCCGSLCPATPVEANGRIRQSCRPAGWSGPGCSGITQRGAQNGEEKRRP